MKRLRRILLATIVVLAGKKFDLVSAIDGRKNSMKKLLIFIVCTLLIGFYSDFTYAVTLSCEWTAAGDGVNYSDSNNWDIGVVPCNIGTVEFEVNIPNGFSVNVDTLSCEVSELILGTKSKLEVPGNIYTVLDDGDIDNSYVHVDEGGIVTIPVLWYSSTGLWASATWSHTRHWNLFNVSDAGTLLDLSSVVSINAGFNDGDIDDYNIHRITASSGGKIDLSGVETITGPSGLWDHLDFILSGEDSEIDLALLNTLTSTRGYTLFDVTNGGTLYMPSLEDARQVVFDLDAGATVSVDDPDDGNAPPPATYSSTGLWASATWSHTRHWNLFNVSDAGTLLDLSSVVSINAGFNDGDIDDYNIHRITASSGGKIDLSGVETITGPVRGEDRLDFIVTGGLIKLGNLNAVGHTYFTVTGISSVLETAALEGEDEVFPGQIHVFGNLNPEGSTDITVTALESGPETAILEVEGDVILNKNSPTTLVLSEATLKVGGDLWFSLTDEEKFKAADIFNPNTINSIVHFDGSDKQLLEVGGLDVDLMWEILSNDNFGFGKLIVGQEEQATEVILRNCLDNGNGREALFLFGLSDSDPNGLYIHGGSTLVLNGINVYALRDGERVHINALFPSGVNVITYDGGGTIKKFGECEGDFDYDGDIDGLDLVAFASEFGRSDCSDENPCAGNFCCGSHVDNADLAIFAFNFGRTDCIVP